MARHGRQLEDVVGALGNPARCLMPKIVKVEVFKPRALARADENLFEDVRRDRKK
jgi:hypothetical protein